jgi:hypothetical protein
LFPIFLSTGRLSHVSIDSSIEAVQEMIIQSTGILSHGLTNRISQFLIFSIFISLNSQLIFTKAIFGASDMSFFIASFVFDFDLVSKYFQKQTNVMRSAETSK